MPAPRTPTDFPEIRRRLAGLRGGRLWRGLEELAGTEEFGRFLAAEFPALARRAPDLSRRAFLRLMGGSLALAGLAGCSGEGPPEEAVPYVNAPEALIPGRPRYYATAALFEGYAQPVLGETHEGRPTKLEGNPDHPASRGATDAFTQAAILQFYDPERSQSPTFMGRPAAWSAFATAAAPLAARLAASGGEGLRLLTGDVTSPTLLRQLDRLRERYPQARRHGFEPAGTGFRRAAARLAFGRPLELHLALDKAEAVISLEDDLLGPGPRQTVHAAGWAARRDAAAAGEGGAWLEVLESTPSLTGVVAARRRPVASGRIPHRVLALAAALGLSDRSETATAEERDWAAATAQALDGLRGRSLVAVGAHQPPEIQALGFAINERLGNLGATLWFSEPVAAPPDGEHSLAALAQDMEAGRVEALVVLDANPAYAAPADLRFTDLMQRVPLRIHAGLYYDETAAHSHWHLPLAHALESWSDARAADGTAVILQPLVRPFYQVRSAHEIVAMLLGDPDPSGREILRATWRERFGDAEFEERWTRALHDGLVPGTAAQPVAAVPRAVAVELPAAEPIPDGTAEQARAVELVFRPDPSIWDGRFFTVPWLQELPKPLTKVTWDNVVQISPRLAEALRVESGDHVAVEAGGATVVGPAWVMPGQARDTVTLFLGYGPFRGRTPEDGMGYDAYRLRMSGAPWRCAAAIRKTEGRTGLATTQLHFSMEGFDFVRLVGRDAPAAGREEARETIYRPWAYERPSWGMAIDLDRCIGCNACVVACQAENNVPVVGREQVALGREMHWLRVDRYYRGDPDDPETFFQPVPCMHCEKAPCEMGCPVHATVHGPEGINQMVYNRCIGTRTCSSYCPYKVRRFNWYDLTGDAPPAVQAQRNPDVTVRDRGVMEKCTYCIQRIAAARVEAQKEGRPLRDGEVRTACQQACPTQTITFGDIGDPESAVSRAKRSPRNYSLLEELNTWPRTTYLARIADPEPGKGGA